MVLGMVLALLGAGCQKGDVPKPDMVPVVEIERIELRVAAPGMDAVQIEAQVVQPIEAALSSTPDLRTVTAEVGDAQARLWLEFEAGQHDAAMIELRTRLSELLPTLPPELHHPVVHVVDVPGSTFARWAIESETIDAPMMTKLHDDLVTRVERLTGALDVRECAPRSRVIIEFDPERLRAHAIDPGEVEAALRGGLRATAGIEGLRRTVIAGGPEQGMTVTLADIAAIRYGMRESTCVAAGAAGLVAAASMTVRDRSVSIALDRLLDEFAAELPAGTRLRRFDAADTTVELSVAGDRELAEVAESIGSGLVRLTQPWLLEVGVEAEPCVGVGTRVRLSVAGGEPVSLASFQSIPGVTHVRLVGAPGERRLWLLGQDADELHEAAMREQTRLRALPGLLAVDVYTEAPRAELRIEPDRARLAALGITTAEFARQLNLARSEIEVAVLHDADGASVPVIMRMGAGEDLDPTQLGSVLIHAGASDIPPARLDAIANIREASAPAWICRHDGQRGVVFVLQAADPNAWPTLAASVEAPLLPGYRWSWSD
jgi:multidrug efflux pump subunit AcrB